ncbi:MAG: signal peptidase II [Cellvibrionales bacterium TMED49]|nr:MAG: signal peptidase II [Cellvibrionales bacterium TMED49]
MCESSTRSSVQVWYLITLFILLLDQIVKTIIVKNFFYGESQVVYSFFNVVRVHNSGAAFSFLSDAGGWQRWALSGLAILVSIMIIIWLSRLTREKWLESLSLSMILGGALGNLWDRLSFGYVVDFLDFHWMGWHFPAFNLADSAISLGAMVLILDSILVSRSE